METVQVLVGKGGHAGIVCPNCQKHHLLSVEKYRGKKHILITKCSCQERFKIKLNFRKFYRKEVQLTGKFINLSTGTRKWNAMIVLDLSLDGIGFKTMGSTDIKQGHQLRLQFTLEDKRATEVERLATVVNVRKNKYGCQFKSLEYDKELGFYLGASRPAF